MLSFLLLAFCCWDFQTEGIHWNVYVEHSPLDESLVVSIECNTWRTDDGVTTLMLARWSIRDERYATRAQHPIHVLVLEGDAGTNSSTATVYINGKLAVRKATGESHEADIRCAWTTPSHGRRASCPDAALGSCTVA